MTLLEVDLRIADDREALDDLGWTVLEMDDDRRDAFFASLSAPKMDLVSIATGGVGFGWRSTPAEMAFYLEPGAWRRWAYVELLGQVIRRAVRGESKRVIVNIASRYGKSLWLAQWGPAWALDYDPTLNVIISSYGDDLADENADACRQILRRHSGRLRAQLRADRQQRDRFKTDQGGGLLAAGISSAISGFPGDLVILDDPFKNWQEAHSEARRNLVENQYRAVLRTRAESDDAAIIVCHNRWHDDDLTGRLLKRMEDGTGEAWELVRLPTIAEEPNPTSPNLIDRLPDPLGREPGDLLEPQRFSRRAVEAVGLALGSYLRGAMQQQRPSAEEGTIILRSWFRLEDRMPDRADEVMSSWDMKLKDKEGGDYVVGQLWFRTGRDCWLMDQLRGQWNQATTTNAIALMAVRWPECPAHVIEYTGNAPEVMESLRTPAAPDYEVSEEIAGQLGMTSVERDAVSALRRAGMGGLIPHTVTEGSKQVRARAVTPYMEAGDVHLPASASWLGAYLDEMASFDQGAHDDQVDATSQALGRLHGHGVRRKSRPAGETLREVSANV